jgi:SMODS and SLOG-associating 2TM effector domain 1/Protein of unknown function (DUF4231)
MESASDSGPPRGDGRIPFTFRIGVTGHRDLADPETLRLRIREAIVQLLAIVPVAPGAGLALVVVTALAEGADRLVAEEALAAGADRLVLEEALAAGADRLAAEQALAARASRLALEEALAAGAGQVIFEEVLAEGADRKVRKKVLVGLDTRLEVALPMDAGEYARDFQSEASRQEFRFLLAQARENDRWQAPDGLEREEAYERAGRYVVDRCDALIAVWDGEESRGRGGTAEIVGYAQQQGVPIAWVHTKGDLPVSYALQNSRAEVVQAAARKLRKYNTTRIARWRLRRHERRLRADLMPDMTRTIPIDPLGLSRETMANWVFPYFIRADILALRYQRRFRLLSTLIFVLAAIAVVLVTVQAIFWNGDDWGAYVEVLSLLIVLLILWTNHRWRLRDRWISSRFLAERLRSSYFLALAGTGDQRGRSTRLTYLSDSSEAWIERALTEVGARRPELETGSLPVDALRDYLKQYWIDSQISYQRKASRRQGKLDDWFVAVTGTLFVLTLIAALVHSVGKSIPLLTFLHHIPERWINVLLVVSITVPAIGAAIHGIGAQRQYRRHSERYRIMANVLEKVHDDMTDATTIDQVRDVAASTEQVMREENSDWFGVMRFHDMELIT